jgi:hypothetical protein
MSNEKLTLLLFSRLFLFLLNQIFIALILASWDESVKYWPYHRILQP